MITRRGRVLVCLQGGKVVRVVADQSLRVLVLDWDEVRESEEYPDGTEREAVEASSVTEEEVGILADSVGVDVVGVRDMASLLGGPVKSLIPPQDKEGGGV
jgi:hypothetical protein